ncbi:MAG: SHOCT domain-containing protein [Pseudomonadota bacterium]
MARLTEKGRALVADVAARHGVSDEAVQALLVAIAQGGGTQAQFSHPELGGMGQWSLGGMIMLGDMFNNTLKASVDAICTELSTAIAGGDVFAPAPRAAMPTGQTQSQSQGGAGVSLFVPGGGLGGAWWPEGLGTPTSTGAQNTMRYAVFPAARRLAIDVGGRIELFDTGDHAISGVSQQQGPDGSMTFTSQYGTVRVADLARVEEEAPPAASKDPSPETQPAPAGPVAEPAPPQAPAREPAPTREATPAGPSGPASADDIIELIRKLGELKEAGILTEDEFSAKKADLLGRL